jgi:hypothetical protein
LPSSSSATFLCEPSQYGWFLESPHIQIQTDFSWLNLQWLVGGFEHPSHTAGIVAWIVGNLQRNTDAAREQARERFFRKKGLSVLPGSLVGRAKLPEKSAKQSERYALSTFQIAESLGFKGEFRQWEHLLRVGD